MPSLNSSSAEDDESPLRSKTAASHIQFLDLTNGTGGEGLPGDDDEYGEAVEEEEVEDDGDGDDEDDGGHSGAASSGANRPARGSGSFDAAAIATASTNATITTTATPPKTAATWDNGSEQTGRWTKEEHEAFLDALSKYGKEWKRVAAKVKTRTVVQTRTHAQKYFQKLQKSIEHKGAPIVNDAAANLHIFAEEPKKASQRNSKRSVANVRGATTAKPHRRGSAATMSAAQVISTLSNAKTTNAFVAAASSSNFMDGTPPPPPRHGFSVASGAGGGGGVDFATPYHSASGVASSVWRPSGAMKIVAPDPSAVRSKFPEPSPAATGKRKLAELAAARMLAGVDGPPTPPPSVAPAGGGTGTGGLNLKDAPPPPLFGGGGGGKGFALQIVNPESLGVTYYSRKKRGEASSPVTPWDGELEALVVSAAAAAAAVDEEDDKVSLDECSVAAKPPASKLHPVNGPADAFERSPLHQAVCAQDVETLHTLVDVVKPDDLQRLDEAGYSPLHSACAMLLAPIIQHDDCGDTAHGVNEMVRMLLAAGANPARQDGKGNTPLHWAARAGDRDAADQLIQTSGGGQDAKNQNGETPLHWAMRAGAHGTAVVTLLLANAARPGILDKNFRRSVDIAAEGFVDDETSLAAMRLRCGDGPGQKLSQELKKMLKWNVQERRDVRANLLIRSAHSRTLVLHHPECLEHHTKSQADWESPDRVKTIMRRILPSSDPTGATETSGIFPHEVSVSQEFDRANLDLLSRVHSTEYLTFVNQLSKDLSRRVRDTDGSAENDADQGTWSPPPVVPFTPMVQRSMIKIDESSVKLSDNSDTSFSSGSLRAARRAAGAVQHAVDWYVVTERRRRRSPFSRIPILLTDYLHLADAAFFWAEIETPFVPSGRRAIMQESTGF